MSDPVAMRKIRAAAQKRVRAEEAKREATDQLQTYCREARRAGVPVAQIASAAGLSRQGVYDLLG
jgi:crotonobetainyl-CoA:carnitine CoA-transferase CaiB-like acyl-CoA transferase